MTWLVLCRTANLSAPKNLVIVSSLLSKQLNQYSHVEERIFNLLDSTSQNIITSWTSGSTLSECDSTKLIYGLNNVIKNDTLYDSTVFTSKISLEGEELKSQYPEL